jgi:hypothetical protein
MKSATAITIRRTPSFQFHSGKYPPLIVLLAGAVVGTAGNLVSRYR